MNWPIFSIEWRTLYFTFQTFHLQYKHSGTFSNRKSEELSYAQKYQNVQPHSSNSIENATRSSGTSPLASCKEVPPPPRLPGIDLSQLSPRSMAL